MTKKERALLAIELLKQVYLTRSVRWTMKSPMSC